MADSVPFETTQPESTQLAAQHPRVSPRLEPILSPRTALQPRHLAVVSAFGLFFLYLSYLPLWPTDLWSHVIYGQQILKTRHLPTVDPTMPLAQGMAVVDTEWLSQVIFASIDRIAGPEGLSALFAFTVLASSIILARVIYLRSQSLAVMSAGLVMALLVSWVRLPIIRPEMFGVLCFVTLLWLLQGSDEPRPAQAGSWPALSTSRRRSQLQLWLTVPALFALWANLHASFFCGLAVLACRWLGECVESVARTRSLRSLYRDDALRRWLLLTEVAALATLLNPYGLDLWLTIARFTAIPTLADISEWQPLDMLSPVGIGLFVAWAGIVLLLRHSRRTVSVSDTLTLLTFTFATILSVRFGTWLAPVLAWFAAPLAAELWQRRLGSVPLSKYPTAPAHVTAISWRYTWICLLVVWVCFSLSHAGRFVVGGKPRDDARMYGSFTPWKVTNYLKEYPPVGQVWNPQPWGDWLDWAGPKGIEVFTATHVHLIPNRVWRDYLTVYEARPGWERVLDKYRVNTLVVDKQRQPIFAPLIRRDTGWRLRYEDDEAMVLTRPDFTPPALRNLDKAAAATPQLTANN
jgi:hypothetical protein